MKNLKKTAAILLMATCLVSCSSSKGSKSVTGGASTEQSGNLQFEQDAHKALSYAKKHSMIAGEAADPGRSNAWFVAEIYQELSEGQQFSDDSGFVASPFPQISEDDTPIRAGRPTADWPSTVSLCFNRPCTNNCLVLRRDIPNKSIVAEAFGEDQSKPLFSEIIYPRGH